MNYRAKEAIIGVLVMCSFIAVLAFTFLLTTKQDSYYFLAFVTSIAVFAASVVASVIFVLYGWRDLFANLGWIRRWRGW